MASALLLICGTATLYSCLHYLLRSHLLKNGSKNEGDGLVSLSRADVTDMTTKTLSGLHALVTSAVGVHIMWETADDCLHSRSQIIVPFTYVGISYVMCDLCAMHHAYCQSRGLAASRGQSVLRFVRSKPLLVLHHVVLLLCYPILVYDGLRKGMGDFFIGTLFIRELSSPLVSAAKIMRRIGAEDSAVYQVIGAALVLVFFLVRVANTPLTLLLYAAQHHHWSLYRALSAMRLICHSMLVAELTLQLHWFSQILSVASRVHLKPS